MSRTISNETSIKDNLFHALEFQAKRIPNHTALIYQGKEISYTQLYNRAAAIAEQLHDLGVKKQEKVAILFPNHPEFVASFFAVVGLGAVVVPVNPLLKSEEICHILSDSNAKALIVDEGGMTEALNALSSQNIPALKHLIIHSSINQIPHEPGSAGCQPAHSSRKSSDLSSIGSCNLSSAPSPSRKFAFNTSINSDEDLALLVYTSGTTGKPKGAMLTHRNISSAIKESLFDGFGFNENDRFLGALPLCHIYGAGVLVYSNVVHGSSLVITPKFEAKQVLDLIEKHRITVLPLVPTMYQFLLIELAESKRNISSVRYCLCAAAPLSPELQTEIESAFSSLVYEGYALSETACGGTISPPKAPKKGSIGKPISCLEMMIRGEDGQKLGAGPDQVGEIAIRGPNVMKGYYGKPEATAEAFSDGWFLTGDLGYKDEEGYYYIVGRKKELIIRGGANIYPREVEEVLLRMPVIKDAAVIGVPDKMMGERVKAIVVLQSGAQATEDQIKEFCSMHLAPYKVPRLVEFRGELPRNSTGKILKRALV